MNQTSSRNRLNSNITGKYLSGGLKKWMALSFLAAWSLLIFAGDVMAIEAEADFNQNCKACHTIGSGRLVGPDLKNVLQRRERQWLVGFIMNPISVINAGDPYALKLQKEASGMVMPTLPGVDEERAQALLDFIAAKSGEERPVSAAVRVEEKPLTEEDVKMGKEIFLGTKKLATGGSACLSCHSIEGLGFFSGGSLAPDLTDVYERLGQRKGLTAWLSSPATPTMRSAFSKRPFTEEEIHGLVALFQKSAGGAPSGSSARLAFVLIGGIGAVIVLVIFALVWRSRFRSVRQALFDTATSRG